MVPGFLMLCLPQKENALYGMKNTFLLVLGRNAPMNRANYVMRFVPDQQGRVKLTCETYGLHPQL